MSWADLEALLEEERALLMAGRLTELTELASRKTTFLESLTHAPSNMRAPDRVRAMAERNAHLLEAAGQGIRSALSRLEEMQSAAVTKTYDANGARRALVGPNSTHGSRV